MKKVKTIALVAHDTLKKDLVNWVAENSELLSKHKLVCTGTTGAMIKELYLSKHPEVTLDMKLLKSGPLGGDQQLGAMIATNEIDFLVFLADQMTPQPHDVDVKALIRVAVIYNIILACNITTADFVLHSTLFDSNYEFKVKDYSEYLKRKVLY